MDINQFYASPPASSKPELLKELLAEQFQKTSRRHICTPRKDSQGIFGYQPIIFVYYLSS